MLLEWWQTSTKTAMEMFSFFARQVHKSSFVITRVNLLIVNLDYTPKQTQLQGLRGTIDWINRKGLCDFDLYVLYQI